MSSRAGLEIGFIQNPANSPSCVRGSRLGGVPSAWRAKNHPFNFMMKCLRGIDSGLVRANQVSSRDFPTH